MWDVAGGHMRSAKDFDRFFRGGELEGFGVKRRGRSYEISWRAGYLYLGVR